MASTEDIKLKLKVDVSPSLMRALHELHDALGSVLKSLENPAQEAQTTRHVDRVRVSNVKEGDTIILGARDLIVMGRVCDPNHRTMNVKIILYTQPVGELDGRPPMPYTFKSTDVVDVIRGRGGQS